MTNFDSIYSLFFSQIDDYELGKMVEDEALEFLYNHLLISTVEFKSCKKDLDSITPPNLGELTIDFNGGTEVSIVDDLTELNQALDFTIYNGENLLKAGVDYIVKTIKDGELLIDIVITKKNLKLPDILTMGWTFSGEFKADLTTQEKYILALGMLLSWLNHKIYREENLRQVIGDTDYKGYSSANLLSKMSALKESLRIEYKEKMVSYSYKGFTGLS